MSLQVWLPLNGSMKNQGLLNLTPTQTGSINWVDGKIGKCLSAGNANQTTNGISYNSNLTVELGTEFSAAVWVKPLGNHVHYNGTFISSGDWNSKAWAFGVNQNNSQVDVFCQGYNTYINCTVPINTWTHLCCVHQGTTVKLYKNGEYIGEKTNVSEGLESSASNFYVGRETYAGGYFSFNGLINDVRIYDHCLSAKEVKLISQGLTLHYPLNQKELDLINRDTLTHEYCLKENGPKSTSGWCYTDYISVNPNAHYLGIGLSSGGSNTYAVLYDGLKNQTRALLLTANQDLIVNTDNTEQYIRLSIRKLSNELNTTAKFIYINPIIYDTSGYCNNGTIIETLTTSNDTSKYDCSTEFNGTTSGIIINNLALNSLINNNITYSFWIKPDGENGARSVYFGSYNATSWSIEKNTSNLLRLYWNGSPDEVCSGATITDGIWQHICITKNGSNDVKVYINGQQKWFSTAAHNALTFPTTYRIGRDIRSGDGTPYKGLMSDFRIYATTLSAEDIAELYSVGASIDNQGNIFTYQLEEG